MRVLETSFIIIMMMIIGCRLLKLFDMLIECAARNEEQEIEKGWKVKINFKRGALDES